MDNIFGVLFGIIAISIPLLVIGSAVFLLLKLRSSSSVSISYRIVLRVYFYIVLTISIVIISLGGLATLINVGLGEAVDPQFSYGNVYRDHSYELERIANNDQIEQDSESVRSLDEKLDLEKKSNLINGISVTLIGFLILVAHLFGRRWVETANESQDSLRKVYLIAGLSIFAVASITSLASAIPEALRYVLLEVNQGDESPGMALSISLVSLPIWAYFLLNTIRTMRSSEER